MAENGGVGAAVIRSALGNGVGVKFGMTADELYTECYGDLIVSVKDESALAVSGKRFIGNAEGQEFVCGGEKVSLQKAVDTYLSPLESVFATTAPASGEIKNCDFSGSVVRAMRAAG